MKQKYLILFSLLFLLVASCKEKAKPVVVNNPFVTPEGCVKEYLDAESKRDMSRMLNCYSYDTKYERILREGLQNSIDKDDGKVQGYTKIKNRQINSVTLKAKYPNSAVVTVDYTSTYIDNDVYSDSYDLNLVKDGMNWKLEAQFSYTISAD